MHDNFQKIKNILAIYIKTKCIELNVYLHLKNILNVNNSHCDCE